MPIVTPAAVNIAVSVQAPTVFTRVSPGVVNITASTQAPTVVAIAPAIPGLGYEVKLTTRGASSVTLANAVPGEARWELNGPGSFDFTMHVLDPQAPLVLPWEREAQLWRDNRLLWAGPVVTVDAKADSVSFRCEGLLAYLFGRNIDRGADRTNLLTNPEFESGLAGWTAVDVTATDTTSRRLLGQRSAKLSQANAGVPSYLRQQRVITAGGVGELVTQVMHFFIEPAGWVGPAAEGRGLRVSRVVSGAEVGEIGLFDINNDTDRGQWVRAEVSVHMPPNATETIEVRLYAPGGVIHWDAGSLTLMESLSRYVTDQAEIAANIVAFLQGTFPGFAGVKSDLGIAQNCPPTGVVRDRHYQFADHVSGETALREFTEMEGGFDIEVTPRREFRTHYPAKGVDRTASVTLSPANANLTRWAFDGHQAASSVVVLGEGDGPDREEGGAQDTTLFGGVTLDKVISPRGSLAIDVLDETATKTLGDVRNPRILEVEIADRSLIGVLDVGDKVTASYNHGYVQASGAWRVAELSLDSVADALSATLNPA